MTSVPPAVVERQLRMAASLMRARPDLKEQVVSDLVEGEWLGVMDAMRWASELKSPAATTFGSSRQE